VLIYLGCDLASNWLRLGKEKYVIQREIKIKDLLILMDVKSRANSTFHIKTHVVALVITRKGRDITLCMYDSDTEEAFRVLKNIVIFEEGDILSISPCPI